MKYTSFNRPLDWQSFERLTRDLFRRLYRDPHADLFGRSGQAQGGLDLFDIEFDGRRIGVQCKGRNDSAFSQHQAVTKGEFRAAIKAVRENFHDLDLFVFMTTGPNDALLKRIAYTESQRDIDGRKLKIKFHGWDWFEGHLSDRHNLPLAIDYGLIATLSTHEVAGSAIAREIGDRFRAVIATINQCEPVSIQSLARHLDKRNWRRLEDIADGVADAEFSELEKLAIDIGVSPDWLIKGKSTPFAAPRSRGLYGPMDLEKEIKDLSPRRIYFVRKISADGNAEAVVVLEVDDIRWRVFPQTFPIRGSVGSGGESQIFEFLCLIRRLRQSEPIEGWRCSGAHITGDNFERLIAGDAYPASVLRNFTGDPWWDDFGDMSDRIDTTSHNYRSDLGSAVFSARMMFGRYQMAAQHSSGHRKLLEWAHLPVDNDDAQEGSSGE